MLYGVDTPSCCVGAAPIAVCLGQHLGWQAATGAMQYGSTKSKLLVRLQDWAGSWWNWQWRGLLYTLWPTRHCHGQHGRGTARMGLAACSCTGTALHKRLLIIALWNSDAVGAGGLLTDILSVIASTSFATRRNSLGASLKAATAVLDIVLREIQECVPYSDVRSWAKKVRMVNGIGVHV